MASAGVVRPHAPWTLARVGRTVLTWGTGPAGGFQTLYQRWPERECLVDERGSLLAHATSICLIFELGAQ